MDSFIQLSVQEKSTFSVIYRNLDKEPTIRYVTIGFLDFKFIDSGRFILEEMVFFRNAGGTITYIDLILNDTEIIPGEGLSLFTPMLTSRSFPFFP